MRVTLRQHTWCIFLMLFVMGWSSIVLASSNLKQMNEQSHSAMLYAQNHSFDQHNNKIVHENSHTSSMVCAHEEPADDCQMMFDHQSMMHSLCQDCTTFHCQNTFSFIDIGVPLDIDHIVSGEFSKVFNSSYSIQFSVGYPQDLFRPPQV